MEVGEGPEPWIDLEIVACVVAMVGRRKKYGVQVECIDAKIQKVIEMPKDSAQVTALESPLGGWCAPFLYIRGIVDSVAIGEAVRKNLVKDGVLNPVGSCHLFFPS